MEVLSEKERITDYAKELKISVIKDELDDFKSISLRFMPCSVKY